MDEGITVTGVGEAAAAADVVQLSLSLTADAKDVSTALREVGARVQAVVAAARAQGVAERDVRSSGAGVQPRYGQDGLAVVGYQAYHSLEVTGRDLSAVSDLVASFAEAAGNALAVNQIVLTIADQEPLAREARDAAFASARDKAEQYAALAGRSLAAVVSVDEGGEPGPGVPYRMAAKAMAFDAMPVQPGESTVRASVTVRWSLGPADQR